LKRFRFLATKLSALTNDQASTSGVCNSVETVQGQLIRYIAEVEQSAADDALAFWAARRSSYRVIINSARDLEKTDMNNTNDQRAAG